MPPVAASFWRPRAPLRHTYVPLTRFLPPQGAPQKAPVAAFGWRPRAHPCLRTPLTRFLFLSAPRFEGVGFFAGLILLKLRASCAPSYEFGEREGDVRHHLRLVVIPMALDAGTTAHVYA